MESEVRAENCNTENRIISDSEEKHTENRCEFCNKLSSSKSNLKAHQLKSKKCLNMQNQKPTRVWNCNECNKEFTVKDNYETHISRHINNPIEQENRKLKKLIEDLKSENITLKDRYPQDLLKENERQTEFIQSLIQENKDKQKRIDTLSNITISLHSDTIIDENQLSPNNKVRTIIRNHNEAILKTYFMFKTLPCMYIISFNDKHKFGYTDDMNKVLQTEKMLSATLKIEYLVYSSQAYTLEQTMLLKYKKKLKSPNHKVILGLTTEIIIDDVRKVINILNIEHEEETKIFEYNNNFS